MLTQFYKYSKNLKVWKTNLYSCLTTVLILVGQYNELFMQTQLHSLGWGLNVYILAI